MIGGGEQSFLGLVSHLRISWKVLAAVPHDGELVKRLRTNDISVQISALPSLRPVCAPSILKALKSHVRTCSDFRPQLIYANGSRAAFYGGVAGRLLRVPMTWHCRIADRDPYMDFLLSRLSTRIIANSKATARRFSSGLTEKVRVVYNGVDLEWLRRGQARKPEPIQEGWNTILVVARVSRSKRHDLALSAFEQVAASNPLAHLVFVGAKDELEPQWWQYLQERSRLSALSNRIHWAGPTDDVRPWYHAASVLLLPSENEAFGRVLIEAMACGVPVIATRTGGIPEFVKHGENGLLVCPGNSEEMAQAVHRILNDCSLKERLTQAGLRTAHSFSLREHLIKMAALFSEVALS